MYIYIYRSETNLQVKLLFRSVSTVQSIQASAHPRRDVYVHRVYKPVYVYAGGMVGSKIDPLAACERERRRKRESPGECETLIKFPDQLSLHVASPAHRRRPVSLARIFSFPRESAERLQIPRTSDHTRIVLTGGADASKISAPLLDSLMLPDAMRSTNYTWPKVAYKPHPVQPLCI